MPYKKDGSPYKFIKGKAIQDVLNYGWLSSLVPYYKPNKSQNYKIFQELADSVFHEMTRGHHLCQFCGWEDFNYGNGEMWLKIEGKTYIFPRMIWHYVKVHEYGLPEDIYMLIESGKFETLTEQNITEIHNGKSVEVILDSPILVCRAMWREERYSNMGEFFNQNSYDWGFSRASVRDGFYIAEMYSPPQYIEVLFENDPENFPDQILITLEREQN